MSTENETKQQTASDPAVGSRDLLECPTDREIGLTARQFSDDQGQVPTAFAFQAGARWAREVNMLRHSNDQAHVRRGEPTT